MSSEQKYTRRRVLTILLLGTAGLGLGAFGGFEILPVALNKKSDESALKTSPSSPQITIKVLYLGMPYGAVNVNSENIAMRPGSYLSELIGLLDKEHPALAKMGSTMQVLLNGMAPDGNPILRDGDEVDFLPFTAGG